MVIDNMFNELAWNRLAKMLSTYQCICGHSYKEHWIPVDQRWWEINDICLGMSNGIPCKCTEFSNA